MSLEAIQFLAETEEKARQMKAAAAVNAKKCIADAQVSGKAMLEDALKKAESELEALSAVTTEEAGKSARELVQRNQAMQAGMKEAALAKMPEAVAFIVERIVTA